MYYSNFEKGVHTIELDYSLMRTKDFHFTNENISDLLLTAFNGGGISYWCDEIKINSEPNEMPESYADVIPNNGSILITAFDNDRKVLTMEKLLHGIKEALIDTGCDDVETFMDDHDADTADFIIQHALFGKMVYC